MSTDAVIADSPTEAGANDPLAQPLTLSSGQTLPNRIAKAALSEQLGDRAGNVSEELIRLYSNWGAGGAGLLITGNVMVDRNHVGEPKNVIVEDERDLDGLKRWAATAKAGGSKVWVQLNHPGRQSLALAGSRPVAPSPVAMSLPGYVEPKELSEAEIQDIIKRFATTAAVCEKAGFDGVQIHGAHGYLIAQFLSPLANRRTDEWGGDPERRRRFVVEVARAIKAATSPGFGVGIKLNSADFQRGGFSEDESRDVAKALEAEGLDLLEVSGGTYEAPAMIGPKVKSSTVAREAYFLEFAQSLRNEVSTPIMVTGGFRTASVMREAVADGSAAVIGMGRPFCVQPHVAADILGGKSEKALHMTPKLGAPGRLAMLDSAIGLFWFTRQIQRLGRGVKPKLNEHPLVTIGMLAVTTGLGSARRKRNG